MMQPASKTKSLSVKMQRGVEKFFGIADDEKTKKKLDTTWTANTSRMHARSVLVRPKKSRTGPMSTEESYRYKSGDVEMTSDKATEHGYVSYHSPPSGDAAVTCSSYGEPDGNELVTISSTTIAMCVKPRAHQYQVSANSASSGYDEPDGTRGTMPVHRSATKGFNPPTKQIKSENWLPISRPSNRVSRNRQSQSPPNESIWKLLEQQPDEECKTSYKCSIKPSVINSYDGEPGGVGVIDISFYDRPAVATGAKTLLPGVSRAAAYAMDETDSAPLKYRTTKKGLQIPKRHDTTCGEPQFRPASTRVGSSSASGVSPAMEPDEVDNVRSGSSHALKPVEEGDDDVDGRLADFAKNIQTAVMDELIDNSNRREVGIGLFGWCLGLRRSENIDNDVQKRLDEEAANLYRPYFTYWVSFVQIVCFIVSVCVYGIATPGGAVTTITGEVLTSSLSIQQVSYFEDSNFWIGPRQADLIHLGAKYSPCMRDDENVRRALAQSQKLESGSACCVLNDGSGCVQTTEAQCSKSLATWMKWTSNATGPDRRTSGSVCGQDPRYCSTPASTGAFQWPDDILRWPICEVSANVTSSSADVRHMTVPLAGRPCCIGVQGQCVITTREYCTFRRGYFHEEANLCAQVSCLSEVCGMIPFYNPEKPDQFYRLWISLFIHAGIFQLLISLVFQLVLMRDIEKFLGWFRICLVYCICGISGSLASAIFIPYHIEAGPSGSQFGLLALFYVEFLSEWSTLDNKKWAFGWLIVITLFLFALGLLPMIDNYAHLIGFIIGFPLGFALMPNAWFGQNTRSAQIISVLSCLLITIAVLVILIILFYVVGVYECPGCQYFNCVPLTDTFCQSSEVKIVFDSQY